MDTLKELKIKVADARAEVEESLVDLMAKGPSESLLRMEERYKTLDWVCGLIKVIEDEHAQ
jgi:hypothetical protein